MKRIMTLVSVLALVIAACGGDSGATDGPDVEPDKPVLTVTSEGGFVPVESLIGNMPMYVITADRTAYWQGPMIEIFPGPLLPNVRVGTISEADWKEVLALIEDLGMADYDEKVDEEGADQIADAGTTVFTYTDENGEHRLAIYALGFTSGSADRLLASEIIQILDETAASDTGEEYTPVVLQVAAGTIGFDLEPGMANVEPWPLDGAYDDMTELMAGWRCAEITGSDVARLMDTFAEANQATLWDTGDEQVNLKVTPILPGQKACRPPG